VTRFKSGAYTVVRVHFQSEYNTAIGQEMSALKPVLAFAAQPIHGQPQAGLHAANRLGQQTDLIF